MAEPGRNNGLRVTTMTKSDLIDVLCETQKLPKGRAELLVHVIFDALEAALQTRRADRDPRLRQLRAPELSRLRRPKPAHRERRSTVRPKRLPFFKVGKELKERVERGADRRTAGGGQARADHHRDRDSGRGSGDHERHRRRAPSPPTVDANAETARAGNARATA